MAYKVFQNGFPLNASELNNYLMNQSVMVFASTTARDADLTAPTEGMIVWLQDSNKFVYYTGSAWTDVIVPDTTNAIINGAFDIWQRGTSFSANGYTADRWSLGKGGTSTIAITREAHTPGTVLGGVESQYFLRFARSSWNSNDFFGTKIEDVRTYAGQTVTFSIYAKAAAGFTLDALVLNQNFGSGGSASVETALTAPTFTTSWARYTFTVTLPSITGKTIGTGSYLELYMRFGSTAANCTLDMDLTQLEAGSVATPFKRNAPSIQAELAACKRYLPSFTVGYTTATGWWTSTTQGYFVIPFDVEPRVAPTGITVSALSDFQLLNTGFSSGTPTAIAWNFGGVNSATIVTTHTAGSPTATTGANAIFRALNPGSKILFTGCEL